MPTTPEGPKQALFVYGVWTVVVRLKSFLGRGEVCSKSIENPKRDRAEFYKTRHDPIAVLRTPWRFALGHTLTLTFAVRVSGFVGLSTVAPWRSEMSSAASFTHTAEL